LILSAFLEVIISYRYIFNKNIFLWCDDIKHLKVMNVNFSVFLWKVIKRNHQEVNYEKSDFFNNIFSLRAFLPDNGWLRQEKNIGSVFP